MKSVLMSDEKLWDTSEADSTRLEEARSRPVRRRTVLRLAGAFAGAGIGAQAITGETAASEASTSQDGQTPQPGQEIACNEWVKGEFAERAIGEHRVVRDEYRFRAEAGTVVSTEATALDDGAPSISLWDIEGNRYALDDNSGGSPDARTAPVTLPETGSYFIFIRGELPPSGSFRYNVWLNCFETYDT